MSKKEAEKINREWLEKNGAGEFDFKNKDVILYDGGLFAIEVEKKRVLRHRIWISKKPTMVDGKIFGYELKSTKLRGTRIKEDYKARIWFTEIDETINYFKRMKRILNKLGYKTNYFNKEMLK